MIELIKDFVLTLNEELDYRNNIVKHKKNLEATLWGLQEQIRLPENQSNEDQEEITSQINHCSSKIINCNQMLESHSKKLKKIVNDLNTEIK